MSREYDDLSARDEIISDLYARKGLTPSAQIAKDWRSQHPEYKKEGTFKKVAKKIVSFFTGKKGGSKGSGNGNGGNGGQSNGQTKRRDYDESKLMERELLERDVEIFLRREFSDLEARDDFQWWE